MDSGEQDSSSALRAALAGGGVGLALAGAGIVQALAGMAGNELFPTDRRMSSKALSAALAAHGALVGGTAGVIGAGLVLALVLSPMWARTGLRRSLGLVAAACTLPLGFAMRGVPLVVGALALAGLFALGVSKEIAPDSGTGRRLAIILAALGAMVFTTVVPPVAFELITSRSAMGLPFGGFLGVLVLARPMLWVLLRNSAQVAAAARRGPATALPAGAAPVPVNVPMPPGWMWGYLNLRATGQRAFGFLYVDPMGGPSFHVVADLAAPLDPAAMRAAGYRGPGTVRLGAYETLLPAPGMDELQRQAFEQGGATGTVVLALSPAQAAAMALPPMPPWATTYLRVGAA